MRTGLLDSDIVAFRLAARFEEVTAFGKTVQPLRLAQEATDEYIGDLMKLLKLDKMLICLSCREHNFRNDILHSYKFNRDQSDDGRPDHLTALKEYMSNEYETYLRYSLEADDVMGILATHPTLIKGETIIISEDKDMRTVPGLLYAPHRPDLGIIDVTPLQASQFLMWQTICGDPTDGYKGAPGLGKGSVYAKAVLEEDADELWGTVCEAYGSVGQSETEALQQARCAKILTADCYNFKTKEVLLWEPKSLTLTK